ncbi:MAG: hypothetical protein HC812_08295 [Leptolyngbya sp. RL_3_1]|nr:hypothetical protein [Leptolyngbya sp. RL_3_1]
MWPIWGAARLIIIGRDDSTGVVTIANPVTFNSDLLIQGRSITANSGITNDGNDVTLLTRGGNINTTGQTITTTGNGGVSGGNVTLRAIGGNVAFGSIFTQAFGGGNGGDVLATGNTVTSTAATIDPYTGGNDGGRTGNITLQAVGLGGVDLSNVTLYGDNYSSGGGGLVQILSDQGSINLTNSDIFSTNGGSGTGGDVVMTSAQNLTLIDTTVSTNGNSSGFAGNITITARNVDLDNSIISAETQNNDPAGGFFVTFLGQTGLLVQGSNIAITSTGTGVLTMQNNSLITARGLGLATPGGNIFIRGFAQVVALPANPGGANPGNDIITSAQGPLGGTIDIQFALTPGFTISQLATLDDALFNQLQMNGVNDIASTGTIAVLDFSILDNPQAIAVTFIDASSLVGNSCAPASATSSFTVGGRGGTPVNPLAPLSPLVGDDSWIFLEEAAPAESFYNAETTVATTLPAEPGQCYFQWRQAAL